MDWNTVVHQLGWQDLVERWMAAENIDEKCDAGNAHDEFQGQNASSAKSDLLGASPEMLGDGWLGHYDAYIRSISSPEGKSEPIQINYENYDGSTNPFLDEGETLASNISSQITLNDDSWFYLDPKGCEQGPFSSEEMASWYDSGYFEGFMKVRKCAELDYFTVDDLIKKRSQEIFSKFSLSELVPEESVQHATSVLNPFCSTNLDVEKELKHLTPTASRAEENQYEPEKYSFDICRRFHSLSVKEPEKETKSETLVGTPIKFTLAGPRKKLLTNKVMENVATTAIKTPPKKFLAEIDKLKSFWLDVANTKVVGPKKARRLEIQILGKAYQAHIEPDSRASFLGTGVIEFLDTHKIEFMKYRNDSRTVKGESCRSAKIIGNAFIPISFRNIKIEDFKFLIAPDLESFIYLGSDFLSKFTLKKILTHTDSETLRCVTRRFEQDLTVRQNEQLEKVIDSFPCIQKDGLGLTNLVSHIIEFSDPGKVVPFKSPVNFCRADPIGTKLVKKMLALDIIETSSSAWQLPAIVVCKENDESLYLDLRKINALAKSDNYPLPGKDEILDRIKTAEFMSTLEISNLIWQIPLDPQSREFIAFKIEDQTKCYQFKRMPAGLKNVHHEIQRLMDKLFSDELRKQCVMTSESLLIFSKDFTSHLAHLREVAKRLSAAKLTIPTHKSNFCMKSVKCFGYIIQRNSVERDPDACRPISIIPRPETKQRLRIFLQITDWLRNLIPKYDKIVAPLKLLSKTSSKQLHFDPETREAFAHIKTHLTSDEVICGPIYGRPFYVQCNVNFKMIVGLLYQLGDHGEQFPVAYCVKELSNHQEKMMVSELELLAVVTCLKHFNRYLEREHFIVITDVNILSWILNETKLDTLLARWCIELQKYDFTLQQRMQSKTVELNILSRVDSSVINEIKSGITDSKQYCPKYNLLRKQIVDYPHQYPDYKVEKNLVYCRREFSCGDSSIDRNVWKICLPRNLAQNLLQRTHVNAFGNHRSRKEMQKYLESAFYWPFMEHDLRAVIDECTNCRDNV